MRPNNSVVAKMMAGLFLVEDEPCGAAHDQDLCQRPRWFGDQHDDFNAAFGRLLLAAGILRGLVDKPGCAIEHSHGPDHVDVSDGHASRP